MKNLLFAAVLFVSSCKLSKLNEGTYRVESAEKIQGKSLVHFEGIKKEFILPTDTLKKGDLVSFTSLAHKSGK